jgi:hypothetical protein
MLRAALTRGPAALAAWRVWMRGADVERLDRDSQWLMPLLYQNLRAHGVAHPILARCRNVYLHGWYRSQTALHALARILRGAAAPDAAIALVGGAAVALRYHDALGARPIGPVELWVPAEARDVVGRSLPDPPFQVRTSIFGDRADARVRGRLEPLTVKGAACAAMAPADQLVHLCAAGPAWDARSRLLWVADAARLLQAAPRLDWGAVVSLAVELDLADSVRETLEYLRGFDVEVRGAALAALAPRARWA